MKLVSLLFLCRILCKHELHQVILWYVELQPWQSTLKGTQVDWVSESIDTFKENARDLI